MPCWYYDKKELLASPSHKDGVNEETEARYRREGARFIVDTGTKMGLSFETCATGVVYFHRFYMFHSFRTFHRYVTAACCLFLAGKVEETPKKCKDIIKLTRATLTDAQFMVFGDDPKEEVMTLERILLQTIKFDLQIEHPYACLLKFAKLFKGDKQKIQKMVQMAWTFINDSLCTTLSLQWEPEIIAVALIYLASRLSKFEVTDWHGRKPDFRGKWWDALVSDLTLDLLEDICHHVLDLYSKAPSTHEDSPPPPPPKPIQVIVPQTAAPKRPRSPPPASQPRPADAAPATKQSRVEERRPHRTSPARPETRALTPGSSEQVGGYVGAGPAAGAFSSSFLSSEGSQTIQSLVVGAQPLQYAAGAGRYGGQVFAAPAAQGTYAAAPAQAAYAAPPVPVAPAMTKYNPTGGFTAPTYAAAAAGYPADTQYTQQYTGYTAGAAYAPPASAAAYAQPYAQPPSQPPPTTAQPPAYPPPARAQPAFTQYPAPSQPPPYFSPGQANFRAPVPTRAPPAQAAPPPPSGMPVVRITGRRS